MQVVRLPPFDSEATKLSAANALRLSLLANAAYLDQPDAKRVANDLRATRNSNGSISRSNFVIFMDLPLPATIMRC